MKHPGIKNSKGIKVCFDQNSESGYHCSLDTGHFGDHAAYESHIVRDGYVIETWHAPVTEEEIHEALQSVQSTVKKRFTEEVK